MKKILSLFLVLVAVLSLVACKKDPEPRTYMADGEYTAYVAHDNDGALQVTWVTVKIENDEIKSFFIDQLQSKEGQWNAQTKKELGYKYGMHQYTAGIYTPLVGADEATIETYKAWLVENDKLEWFEQANLIETHFLTTLDVTTAEDGTIQGISNVTIADNQYIALAKQAVENAKAGIVNVFKANMYDGAMNLVSASAKINAEGKLSEVKIDELQTSEGAWKAQTKQQLGYKYGMHQYTAGIYTPLAGADEATIETYKTWLVENNKLEWFQQVDALAAAWLNGANVSDIKTVSGVTINDSDYSTVLAALLAEGWSR